MSKLIYITNTSLDGDVEDETGETLNYGCNGTPLGLSRVHLELACDSRQTPRSTLVGPLALPGTYTAKLTVNGQSDTHSITVVRDPRITVLASALAAQFLLQQRMVASCTTSWVTSTLPYTASRRPTSG